MKNGTWRIKMMQYFSIPDTRTPQKSNDFKLAEITNRNWFNTVS